MTSRATLLAVLRASCAVIALAAVGAPARGLASYDGAHERLSGGHGDDGDHGGGDRDGGGGDRDGGGGDRDGGGGDSGDREGGDRDGGGDSGDRDAGDRDSSGSASGEDRDGGDRDSSGSGSGDDRDSSGSGGGDDRDSSGSGSGDDRDGSGSGGGDDDRSGSGDDRSGSDSGSDDGRSGSDDDSHSGSDDSGSDDHGGSTESGDDHGGDSRGDYDQDDDASEASSDDHSGFTAEAVEAARGASVAALDLTFDEGGREYREHEIVLVANEDELAAVRRLGLPIMQDRALAALGGGVIRIQVPDGQSTETVLAQVRAAAPQGAADLNTVYRLSGKAGPLRRSAVGPMRFYGSVGIIDTAVNRKHPAVRAAIVESRSFAAGRAEPADHGTAVAYLTAGAGARVLAADVFTLDAKGGPAASADAMARAVNWLASKGVAVINLSIAGPPNAALAEVIRRAQVKGIVVVAAAGNGGPAAAPAYPAAYASVVAVTAIDSRHKVYRYANQGRYIVFAARGVDVIAPEKAKPTSGTSFATPLVSAAIASDLSRQDPRAAAEVLARLKKGAKDLGAPGLDPVYGYGMIQPSRGRR